jgi:hypothetical protein
MNLTHKRFADTDASDTASYTTASLSTCAYVSIRQHTSAYGSALKPIQRPTLLSLLSTCAYVLESALTLQLCCRTTSTCSTVCARSIRRMTSSTGLARRRAVGSGVATCHSRSCSPPLTLMPSSRKCSRKRVAARLIEISDEVRSIRLIRLGQVRLELIRLD